jgi:DDE superfamily endonuclease
LAATRPDWCLGFEDETWWSRLAASAVSSWTEAGRPLRLVEQAVAPDDPAPKALAAYGLDLPHDNEVLLRFVEGRPVSALTTQFLAWGCERLAARGKTAMLLVWDNAGWHISHAVRAWMTAHNQQVKQTGQGVRILSCLLPSKSPWLNPIEPKWVHGKRRVVEPDRLLSATELADRACAALGCPHEPHLALPQKVA